MLGAPKLTKNSRFFIKISIKTRLLILAILLGLLPYLSYKVIQSLQNQVLQQQIINQEQLTHFLKATLENQLTSATPQNLESQLIKQLPQLNLNQATIWLINSQGQTELVLGNLANNSTTTTKNLFKFAQLGQKLFPIKTTPTQRILEEKLYLKLEPIFREDSQGKPLSLMIPAKINSKTIIYEQPLNNLIKTLEKLYFIIGLSSLVLLAFILGLALITLSFSSRIIQLTQEVSQLFENKTLIKLKDKNHLIKDETSSLRNQINQLIQEIINHNNYLIQLPKTLRHELHNPINRLNLSLQQLEENHPYPKGAHRGQELKSLKTSIFQLKTIINQLTEASNYEETLAKIATTPTHALPRLLEFINQVIDSIKTDYPDIKIKLIKNLAIANPKITADMFMLEILLDKLIENALSFTDKKEPITLSLTTDKHNLIIAIYNSGHALPTNADYLFKKMVSIRKENQDAQTVHLGLGLYLANLIAEAHQASLKTYNTKQGVEFKLTLPLVN